MIQRITDELIETLLENARRNPRKRFMHTLHRGPWEHAHRMLNAITTGSYARPHKHLDPHKSEAFVILRGKAALVVFDDTGRVEAKQTTILEPGGPTIGVDIAPGTWHTLVAIEDSVLFEVKGQPDQGYDPEEDKVFAAWSPDEASEVASDYLQRLRRVIASGGGREGI